jgi:hypothetical protein
MKKSSFDELKNFFFMFNRWKPWKLDTLNYFRKKDFPLYQNLKERHNYVRMSELYSSEAKKF